MAGAIMAMTSVSSAAVVFSEDWDDGAGSTRWSSAINTQEDAGIAFDGSVKYAFDYSTVGAASAPNSVGGTTVGVAFETNTTDQCPTADPRCEDSDEGESVTIIPIGAIANFPANPASSFKLTADVYMFWNFESGSTEYATFGAYGNGKASPLRFGLNPGDGLSWQFDSDGDSGTDILRYESPGAGETGLGGYETIPNGSIPGVDTCTPGVDCAATTAVGPQNKWVEMSITNESGIVTLAMNGYVLDTFDNTAGGFSGGNIILGGSDPFNSVNIDNGAGLSNMQIFDNIVLSVPEPSSLLLLGFVGAGLLGIRIRK